MSRRVVVDWLGTRGTARAGVMISLGCGTTGAAEVDGLRFFFLLFFWIFGCARGGGAAAKGAGLLVLHWWPLGLVGHRGILRVLLLVLFMVILISITMRVPLIWLIHRGTKLPA